KSAAPSREKIAQAKLLYEAGVAPIADIVKTLGMSAGQFRAFRQKRGWPMRASACARREKPTAAKAGAAKPSRSLIARLEEAVEREFAHAEAALAKHTPKTIEASARTLASLVRTLAELKRMRREADPSEGARDDDDGATDESLDQPPRQLAELRAELARRLQRLRGEGPAR
ncbi:MAG: hypothetical protein HYZ60_01290, partial [Methylocystis sp.]|nr:hypothetical protein [Methylocystis sp.]